MRRIEDEQGNPWHNDEKRVYNLNTGVKGVHCCATFQCEVCWMRNLEGRDPGPLDWAYVQSIRRANLDSMAGKSRHTISGHRRRNLRIIENATRINKTPSLEPRGPVELGDPSGMSLAVDILQESIHAEGRNEAVVQAETLRQMRATYTKSWDSSPAGVAERATFGKGAGRVRPTACPTQSEWFTDFWRGLEKRMGHKSMANHAIPMKAMVTLIGLIKSDAEAASTLEDQNYLLKVGAYLTTVTAAALRGYEGFYVDLAALRRFIGTGKTGVIPPRLNKNTILSEEQCLNLPHVVIPMLGQFKGETGIDHHIMNVANSTKSGLEPRWWLEKLVEVTEAEGRTSDPAFADPTGTLADPSDYDATFRKYLGRIEALSRGESNSRLLPEGVDVKTMFGISRTPRRTATTRAKRAGFADLVEDMNRWRRVELAANRRVRQRMLALYSESVLMMPVTWLVSHAL